MSEGRVGPGERCESGGRVQEEKSKKKGKWMGDQGSERKGKQVVKERVLPDGGPGRERVGVSRGVNSSWGREGRILPQLSNCRRDHPPNHGNSD